MDLGDVGPFGVVGVLLDRCGRKDPCSLGSLQHPLPPGG